MKNLTIVIPTFNEEIDINNCLNSISNQDYPKNLFEVIIVDNKSTDNTINVAKSFSKKLDLKIIENEIKDAEVSKKIGFDNAKGKLFMYLDADMRFGDEKFINKVLLPFKKDKRISGNFIKFGINKHHPALTRILSYDVFQRDPIFKFFTTDIKDIVIERNKDYWLCKCSKNNIPPQGLMVYRTNIIKNYVKTQKQLIDNEIPAVLVNLGFPYFAFVPSASVEHLLLRSLKELWKKRVRNMRRTYFPNIENREFNWINWKTDWKKGVLWFLYTNSPAPIISSLAKILKHRDLCFLGEPILNIVSTYSIIFGFVTNYIRK